MFGLLSQSLRAAPRAPTPAHSPASPSTVATPAWVVAPHVPASPFHFSPIPEARKKRKTVRIRLTSAAGTGFAYTTTKKVALGVKMRFRKYDPVIRQHCWFVEEKISRKRVLQRKR
eukprot:TRINITY_DN2879_c0_g1_i1.p1 TRINITY_DN2879_c0_g1~~TRINITY_DN2879_c0_g1_i1.p1  ORF type:complete len:127 (+),score=30.68 TRINITY_DN2879_c0_g1_i1:36-383(+)